MKEARPQMHIHVIHLHQVPTLENSSMVIEVTVVLPSWDTEWGGSRGSWRCSSSSIFIWLAALWQNTEVEIHRCVHTSFVHYTEFIPWKVKKKIRPYIPTSCPTIEALWLSLQACILIPYLFNVPRDLSSPHLEILADLGISGRDGSGGRGK